MKENSQITRGTYYAVHRMARNSVIAVLRLLGAALRWRIFLMQVNSVNMQYKSIGLVREIKNAKIKVHT